MRGRDPGGKFKAGLACLLGLCLALVAGSATAQKLAPRRSVPNVPTVRPDTFAVMLFENRSGVQGLSWTRAAFPVVLGERMENHRHMRPTYGKFVVPGGVVKPASPSSVASFGKRNGATWVWTGWVARPNWELQVGVSLWKVQGGKATRIGEVVKRGQFKEFHDFLADAAIRLCAKAQIAVDQRDMSAILRPPTRDFYAFTLFGRGIESMLGVGAAPDLAAAEASLKRSTFIDPKLAESWRVLAELYLATGKRKLAGFRLSRAVDAAPRYYSALVARATLDIKAKKYERAAAQLETVVGMRPWELEPRYQLANIYWETSRIDEAFRELGRVVKHDPKHVRARRLLVLIHASKGKGNDLVRELEEVAKLDPGSLRTKMDLAAAYASVGRERDAMKTYEKLLVLDKNNVQALKFAGDLAKRAGNTKKAVSYYRRAVKAKPSDPRSYFLLGALYVEGGDDRAARSIYLRAQRFRDYLPEVYNNLGAIAFRAGKLGESKWYLKQAVKRKPNRGRYQYNLALTLSAANETDDALAAIEAGLKLSPDNIEFHYLHGVVLLRLGRASEANTKFAHVLKHKPDHQDARHNLNILREMTRRIKQGEVVIEGK